MRTLPLDHPGTPDTRSPGRFLWWMAKGQWRTLVMGMVFGIIWMSSQAVMPAAIGRAIDAGVAARDFPALVKWTGLMLVVGLVQSFAGITACATIETMPNAIPATSVCHWPFMRKPR